MIAYTFIQIMNDSYLYQEILSSALKLCICLIPDDVKQSHLYTVNMLNFSNAYFDQKK